MKIGFSFGRCISDINTGLIAIEDVIVIIARTRIEDVTKIDGVVDYYIDSHYIKGDRNNALEIAKTLWYTGKIHQPRLVTPVITNIGNEHHWMDVSPTTDNQDPNVLDAWRKYQLMLRLASEEQPVDPQFLKSKL